jgi:endo-1,4-beta-xylanase
MQRRCLLGGLAAAALVPAARARAASGGILFGAMVESGPLSADPAFAAVVAAECAVIVPGVEAKWAATEPSPGGFRFAALDTVAAAAAANDQHLRLHNLVWGVYNPPWVAPALLAGRGRAVLHRHIEAVAGHTRGRAWAWDVLNECIDTRWPADPDGLITDGWWHALGPGYAAEAMHAAHAADPGAKLFINDDWLEYPASAAKRAKYLRLVERWVAAGVPIHGFGLEAHLQPDLPFDAKPYRRFLADIAATGLSIHVTELDVHDRTLPSDIAARDWAVADTLKRYLDTTLDEPAVEAVLTWALTDRYNYQNRDPSTRRPDGLPSRGGLLDASLGRKPAWFAVASALAHARDRRVTPD